MPFQSLEDAVFNGSSNLADAVRYVQHSGNPNELFDDHQGTSVSLLHYFVMGKTEVGVEIMLRIGADPNTRASDGLTALWMAVIMNDPKIARLLVDAGADVNARDPRDGNTPLHAALINGSKDIAKLLIEKGANPDISNYKGITARHLTNFKAMIAGGWDTSKPNKGSSFFDNLNGMSEQGLVGMTNLLPIMIKSRVESGEITPQRGAMLNSLVDELKQTDNLPLEIRSTRIKEIKEKLLAIL